jgi:ribonuclease P protein component
MLPKDQRLNLKKEFSWVASGQKIENQMVKVFFRFGSNHQPRVGISLSGKVFKKAVDRNRAKRIIATGFQTLYSKLPENLNIIALPKITVLNLSADEVTESLEVLLKRTRLLN